MTLHNVYATPTPISQAERLVGAGQAQGTHALAARRTGRAPALFAVPTGIGDIGYAFELAAHLDVDVSVYALPWPEAMPTSMDALATHMVDLMRAAQPHGPYRLLGGSSGGLLAYAVAQLLAELDEPVDFVGLLDCHNASMSPMIEAQESRAKDILVGQLQQLVQEKYSEQEEFRAAGQQLEASAPGIAWAELVAQAEASPALRALVANEQSTMARFVFSCVRVAAYETMWPAYLAQPLPAPLKLHLFCATETEDPPQLLGWDRLLPLEQIEVVTVPGTHSSMKEAPHIGVLGRAVSQALRQAQCYANIVHAPALAIQRGDRAAPIVCVPGAGDSIISFVQLGIALGTDRSLIGMQPRGVDGHALNYGSVELAAAAYRAAMPSHVPRGATVHLLGHSFGGWVVFEMARQLQATGATVGSLTLIDTGAPDDSQGMRDNTRDAVVNRFLDALALHATKPLPVDRSSLRGLDGQALIEELHGLMVNLGLMPARSRPDALRGPFYSFARACRTRYCPGTRYDGPVHLVLVRDTRLDADADARQRNRIEEQWRLHAPALAVWHGPGNHMTILDPPHVRELAHWWLSAATNDEGHFPG